MSGDEVLLLVEAHVLSVLGQDSGRASVSFLGTEQIDVLRFGPDPDGLVRYVTLGMSRHPMADPGADLRAQDGPRAELVLTVRGARDSVARTLAVLAASPSVEGLVLAAGAGLELGQPLWEDARFTSALVGEPGGLVPELELDDDEPVRFFPLLPMTSDEAAYKRVHGPAALEELWLRHGSDLRDPDRGQVPLEPPR